MEAKMANRTGHRDPTFVHDSIQDRESIVEYLTALTEGIASGSLGLSSDGGEINLTPRGLLRLRVEARRGVYRTGLVLKISWRKEEPDDKEGSLRITPGEG
jgi:amphi-Trp domain-containing protein